MNHWEIEEIPNDNFVLRHVLQSQRAGSKGRRFPNEAHFILQVNERGLSVNWDKYMNVKNNYILIGLTYGSKKDFLDYKAFRIFKFKVENLRSIPGIEDVIHDPEFNGDPPPIGKPNNRAHSLILCNNDEDIRMNLSDYCRNEFDLSYCKFNMDSLSEEIETLRERIRSK